jgi:hypothetical protein
MGKINKITLKKECSKALRRSSQAKEIAYQEANKRFKKELNNLITEYDNHPITREIKSGPEGSNSSGTLGGRGNLFTFIGFRQNDNDPTSSVRKLITSSSFLHKTNPTIRKTGGGGTEFTFRASFPSKDDISVVTRMPWESGRSWVFAIESGISGLSHYIYRRYIKGSRSGKAIQVENQYVKGVVYRPVSYMSSLLRKFRSRIGE